MDFFHTLCISLFLSQWAEGTIHLVDLGNIPNITEVEILSRQGNATGQTPTLDCNDEVNLTPGSGFQLQSPNYPEPYGPYQETTKCQWSFNQAADTPAYIVCDAFSLPPRSSDTRGCLDSFSIVTKEDRAYPFCGSDLTTFGLQIVSDEQSEFNISFKALSGSSADGFQCNIFVPESQEESTVTPTTEATGGDCLCGIKNEANRIINGEHADMNEHPWHVGLKLWGPEQWQTCGGTLISSCFVLTAAHCVEHLSPDDPGLYITLGDHVQDEIHTGEIMVKVKTIFMHEDYYVTRGSPVNDYALLEIECLNFTDTIRPACLPKDDLDDYTGVEATVTGWGTMESGYLSNTLREVDVQVISNADCQTYYSYRGQNITESMLCAWAPGKDSCQGDSGGPMTTTDDNGREVLIGVVSWGYRCAHKDHPGVYARVTTFLDWIENIVGYMCRP